MGPPLFVFMTHGLSQLSVLMFPDLLFPFLYHAAHRLNLRSLYERRALCNKKRRLVKGYLHKFT